MAKIDFETTQDQDDLLRVYALKNLPNVQTCDVSIIVKNIIIGVVNSMRSNRLRTRLDSMRISEVEEALNDYESKIKE